MISITNNISSVIKRMGKVERSIDRSTNNAFGKLAFDLRKEQQGVMRSSFKSVVPYTLGAIRARTPRSTGNYQNAGVYFIEQGAKGRQAHKYLTPNIKGGERRFTPHEVALFKAGLIPSGAYTQKGESTTLKNGGQYQRMLSQLQAQRKGSMNETAKSKGRKKRTSDFFIMYRGSEPIAIARRTGAAITVELAVTMTKPNYRPRYDFYGTSKAFVLSKFPRFFRAQMRKEMGLV
jgi:hypothetical protein